MTGKQLESFVELIFCDGYAEIFSVIDHDGLRKAAIRTQKTKEYEDGDVDYKVTVNRRILQKFIKEASCQS